MSKGYKFFDPTINSFFETRNARFFGEIEFKGRDKVRDIVFEEEFVSLPPIVIDNDQVFVPDIVQEVNLELQDNVANLLDQGQQVIHDEQT